MLYADDAGVVSKVADGLARMMRVIVEVFPESGLKVSEKEDGDLPDAREGRETASTIAPPRR